MGPRAVLVGPPGSGKSTVGAALAGLLGVAALDTDEAVEARAGHRVADVFAADGEAAFRALEHAAVLEALATHDGVLSLGGGAVLDPRTREALVGQPVVLLDVSWEHAAPRLGDAAARPLLAGDPRSRWAALVAARRPLYAAVATAAVDTDGLAPAEVAARVALALALTA